MFKVIVIGRQGVGAGELERALNAGWRIDVVSARHGEDGYIIYTLVKEEN